MQAACQGDRDALQRLVETNYGSVFRYVLTSLAYDREAAADITQEAFIGAVSKIHTFRGDSTFLTWVIGIATNHMRNALRKGRIKVSSISDVSEECLGVAPDDCPDSKSDEFIRTLVSLLPMGQRQALYLREFLGCTYDEIAVTLGIAVGAAKNRVLEARRNMVKQAQTSLDDESKESGSKKHVNAGR